MTERLTLAQLYCEWLDLFKARAMTGAEPPTWAEAAQEFEHFMRSRGVTVGAAQPSEPQAHDIYRDPAHPPCPACHNVGAASAPREPSEKAIEAAYQARLHGGLPTTMAGGFLERLRAETEAILRAAYAVDAVRSPAPSPDAICATCGAPCHCLTHAGASPSRHASAASSG